MKFNKILDVLYPAAVRYAGDITGGFGRMICPDCLRKLSFVKSPVCKKCGKEIEDESMEFCPDCMRHPRAFEYGIALLNYDETARHSMAQIKYNNKREYLDFYGTALTARYGRTIRRMQADALVPVPVQCPARKKTRGFNQAEILARVIGKKLGIPVMPEMLVRNKKTLPQKDLSAAERLKNLSGAFAAGEIPEGIRSVILVDDIYTTGSTIEACARAAGIGNQRVYFVVICMTGGR